MFRSLAMTRTDLAIAVAAATPITLLALGLLAVTLLR